MGLLLLIVNVIAVAGLLGGACPLRRRGVWAAVIMLLPVAGVVLYYTMRPRDVAEA